MHALMLIPLVFPEGHRGLCNLPTTIFFDFSRGHRGGAGLFSSLPP